MKKLVYRKNVSIRFELELYKSIVEHASEEGITVSNAIENMCKYFLRLPVSDKPTKRGRKKNSDTEAASAAPSKG